MATDETSHTRSEAWSQVDTKPQTDFFGERPSRLRRKSSVTETGLSPGLQNLLVVGFAHRRRFLFLGRWLERLGAEIELTADHVDENPTLAREGAAQ